MSTIVGTNIEVTNLKFDSDTTSMIISNTGQVTIQGEGTATTNLQQGLAKAWVQFNGSSFGIQDSFNLSSMDDNGTGDYTINILNDMSNNDYSMTATGYKPSADFGFITNNNEGFITPSLARIETVEHDGGHKQTEFYVSCVTFHGDLA
tara:strand:- start:455 stop:901 length:447 start_codon:yes stop_codon:yes gene_type:complete